MGNISAAIGYETSIHFDMIGEYDEYDWLVIIGEIQYKLPKSQVRVYHKSLKLYAPNWLLEKEGMI